MKKTSRFMLLLLFLFSITIVAQAELVLSEEEAVELALENNRQIREAKKDIEVARNDLVKARAGYFPTIDLQGSYTRQESFAEAIPGIPEQPANNFALQFSLQQLIYGGGARSASYQQAEHGIVIAEKELEQQKIELAQEIREQYYNILKAEQMVEIINNALTRIERYGQIAEQNYELGIATNTDVLQAEINQNQLKQELLAAKNRVKLTKISFRNSLGLTDDSKLNLTDKLEYKELKADYEQAEDKALDNRLELHMLDLQQANLELNRQQIKSAKRPQVVFNTNYSARGDEFSDAFQLDEGDLQATIAINYNLFDGGSNRADRTILEKELEKFSLNKEDLIDLIKLEVKEKTMNLEEKSKQLELKKLSRSLAKENLEQSELKYEEGLISSLDLLEAQNAYQEAETEYYQGIYDYRLAVFAYQKSIGLGL